MKEKYSHVIWDWNGTILNDVELCVEIGNNLFRRKGLPTITVAKYKSIFTIPVKNYYIAAGFDFSKESFEIVGREWMDEYEERKYECSLYVDLVNTMKKFENLGIGQSLLSAYKQDNLKSMVDKFELTDYLENVVGLDNIYAAGKRHLAKELVKSINNGSKNILMIGDTIHDFEVANEIGADCILVADGHQSKDVLIKSGAKVYDSLKELYRIELN